MCHFWLIKISGMWPTNWGTASFVVLCTHICTLTCVSYGNFGNDFAFFSFPGEYKAQMLIESSKGSLRNSIYDQNLQPGMSQNFLLTGGNCSCNGDVTWTPQNTRQICADEKVSSDTEHTRTAQEEYPTVLKRWHCLEHDTFSVNSARQGQ